MTATKNAPTTQPIRLADYQPSKFSIPRVSLQFYLESDHTRVIATGSYKAHPEAADSDLMLNAQDPNPRSGSFIQSVKRSGRELRIISEGTTVDSVDDVCFYDEATDTLRLPADGSGQWDLEIETYLEPQHNSALSGLYRSDNCFVTQCESEGFRRITPFLDRPDVMSEYEVLLEAPESLCPTLLANGNLVESRKLENGRHLTRFQDPWPKPSYLFCVACGQFDWIEDSYRTVSGRDVTLRVYTDTSSAEKGWHAMEALQRAMKWDEETFGCEYDLDHYGVVAVSKFSMGAMENKGLNVFRDSLVLATPETATDDDYQNIIDVIGHEYFHNYSGNRVTLANWFNLSLKEGLTVNREQLFTAFTTSSDIERISAVQVLRRGQFPEDDGPNAHPVMPAEIGAIDNIYSATVYIKGSEVIRMMKTMMGEEKFIEGVKHYFQQYDGQAVTIAEFVDSMQSVSGLNFSDQFHLWYSQSGRPRLKASSVYKEVEKEYHLTLEQSMGPTRDQEEKELPLVPVTAALIDDRGMPFPLRLKHGKALNVSGASEGNGSDTHELVLLLESSSATFVFEGIDRRPAFHSLLRGFSAPVNLDPGLSEEQLHNQLRMDTDGFNRWDAGQKLAIREMERLYTLAAESNDSGFPDVSPAYLQSVREVLTDANLEWNLKAMALSLPSTAELETALKPVDPMKLAGVRQHLRKAIGTLSEWEEELEKAMNLRAPYQFDFQQVGIRRLIRLALAYLAEFKAEKYAGLAFELCSSADNMTDRMGALAALRQPSQMRNDALTAFFHEFQKDSLTIQKYFQQQAMLDSDSVIEQLGQELHSTAFDWQIPGHVQSLFRGFLANYEQFHRLDGAGYAFLADGVIKECGVNGTTAAGMVVPLCRWRDYAAPHSDLMLMELRRIKDNLESALSRGEVKKEDAGPVMDRLRNSLPGEDFE